MEVGAKQDQNQTEDVHRLSEGFEALLAKVEELVLKNAELGRQLSALQAQHKLARLTNLNAVAEELLEPQIEVVDRQQVCLSQSRNRHNEHDSITSIEVDPIRVTASWANDKTISAARDALKNLKAGNNEILLLQTETSNILSKNNSRSVVGSHKSISVEQDSFAQGLHGVLGSPLASRASYGEAQDLISSSSSRAHRYRPDSLPTPPDLDWMPTLPDVTLKNPSEVEDQAADLASPPVSAQGAASKCPIRFLDQHTPEEIARYFQSHKHEIPRSHEVCVKRYQTNEESIRQLDAKYGNLVNMIQGLGLKHQPMLVPTDFEKADMEDQRSKEKVERWATVCTESLEAGAEQDTTPDDNSHPRSGHFERPLQDVRVGESPSRPWGIQVPYTDGLASSTNSYPSVSLAPAISAPRSQLSAFPRSEPLRSPQQPARCPFGQGLPKTDSTADSLSASAKLDELDPQTMGGNEATEPMMPTAKPPPLNSTQSSPSFVFNGPVLIGYTAEQAAALLQIYNQPKAV
ncbi:hypothetical protein MMC27_006789 [Xylographa pallens]|nr:hypothetical protein [Xylographa pallens]